MTDSEVLIRLISITEVWDVTVTKRKGYDSVMSVTVSPQATDEEMSIIRSMIPGRFLHLVERAETARLTID